MTDSRTNVPFAPSRDQRPRTSSGLATNSEGAQRCVIVDEGVACSGLKPPLYPMLLSRSGQNRRLRNQRSTRRRRREVSSGGASESSGTRNNAVTSGIVVQRGRRDEAEEVPSSPVHTTHAHSACHSGNPAERIKAESDNDSLELARGHEWVEGQMESTGRAADGCERQRSLQEEFSPRPSAQKVKAELRDMREQEREEDSEEFARSGVYTREEHQRPRYWTAAKAWKTNRGFADIAVVRKPLFGVVDRLHLYAARTSC